MNRQRIRVMITVKTYPEISQKYQEISCVAGIRIDTETPSHIRLFPVPFRYLDTDAKFQKYNVIELDVERHNKDQRPESYRPDISSIKVIEKLPADGTWERRIPHVRPLIAESLCAIKRQQASDGTSLGIFRPAEITDFHLKPAEPWTAAQEGRAAWGSLFDQQLHPLEWIPYDFKYKFRCTDEDCTGHEMGLRDWEAGQSYRKFLKRYGTDEVEAKLIERWSTRMLTPDKAIHMFVGNVAAYPRTFMLLGLFYPPADAMDPPSFQDPLF